jgi:hypothetical protein
MSKTAYNWSATKPPAPDEYVTRRNFSSYMTTRYWDGEQWWEINLTGGRGGSVFKWPKKSRTKRPAWVARYEMTMRLRKIGVHQDAIQWGEPYKHYDEKEVLAHLVKTGRLPADWREAYQGEMRGRAASKKAGAA